MSNDLNQCNFIGRLGKEPESKSLPSGEAVVNLSIAVGKSWKDKQSGEKKEMTAWVPVVAFGKLAEIMGQYLHKGSRVFITGEFRTRKWQDKEGKDRYATEIIAQQMQMLDSKPSVDAPVPSTAGSVMASDIAQRGGAPFVDSTLDDVPF